MITKDELVRAIRSLSDDATVDDAVEYLLFIKSVEGGIAEAEAGNVVSHENARRRFAAWLV
jgi:hypothetical protein